MTGVRNHRERVAILWNGLPLYAAAAISAAVARKTHDIIVVATRPDVPAIGMEERVGTPIHWIKSDSHQSFRDLGHDVPEIAFTAGWSVPAFMRLAREVRREGGKVVCMCDNSYRGDARQWLGALVYPLKYGRFFDHAWVPGKSAARLMQFYGVKDANISQGLYTADTTTFQFATPIEERPIRFVFVGQFIDRKNVLPLCDAFIRFRGTASVACDLHLYGDGPLRERIPHHPDIRVHPFANPATLAAALNNARCLILPSAIDHWGIVVHEAASCGTLLIVSDTTGASEDLCGPVNSRIIRAGSEDDMVHAFQWASTMSPVALASASQESVGRATAFSTHSWAATFDSVCCKLNRHETAGDV